MIRTIVENHLTPKSDYVYGFADLKGLLSERYSEFGFGISIGKRLDYNIINKLIDGPTVEYFNHYNNINKELRELSLEIKKDFERNDVSSFPILPTISIGSEKYMDYLRSLSYDISHKMVATRAGLGWIGKTALLITKEFGPRLRLVTILLKKDPGFKSKPVEKSKCGKCDICVEQCPAKAASGILWDVNIHRDKFFNAFKCREKCGELAREKLNINERICGLCLRVCPVGMST